MEIYRLPSWVKTPYDMELYHSGVKGQKHGLRRYQNKDGSLTPLGRIHYGVGQARSAAGNAAGIVRTDIQSRLSNNEYGSARASNLGEVGTGVHTRSRIADRSRLDVSADLSTITPKMTMNAKNFVDASELRDVSMDTARAVELGRIGRSYGQRYGGYTIGGQNYNMATRGVAKGDKRVARRGISSSTSGYTPYGKTKQMVKPGALNRDYKWAMEAREDDYSESEKRELEEYRKKYRSF
ncbi:MAG: hypothetical protein J6Y02_11085 [Pseudobutyrivibrio sp.]|nr:hypothetical protein [Pseudobutyrivibrio sp.]